MAAATSPLTVSCRNSYSVPIKSGCLVLSFRLAISINSGLISYPTEFRSRFFVASEVVPLPMKGSSTVSPRKANILMSRCGSSSGNMARCTDLVGEAVHLSAVAVDYGVMALQGAVGCLGFDSSSVISYSSLPLMGDKHYI